MDIDIDVNDTDKVRKIFKDEMTRASIVENGELKPHIVGCYFQNIPKDPITGLAAIPYEHAEEFGFMKIDILHLSLLEHFKSKREMRALLKKEPNWKLLENDDVIKKLFHLSKHGDIIKKVKPTSVLEIADILALIRPNKKHLIDKYIKNKKLTREELYKKVEKSDLRKSHAIPYAILIVLQLHLIDQGRI